MSFSSRLGYPVHGIIGADFLKDFVVEINNSRERMRFTLPEDFNKKSCRNCVEKDLIIHKNKPYLAAQFIENDTLKNVNLLIDSGSGDGLWLFENSKKGIRVPEDAFEDYLGLGINGNIYGKRSKVDRFILGNYSLDNVNTSYPDIEFLDFIEDLGNRNGSFGGEILKRFNWTIDYKNALLTLKKNSYFKDPFHYNMSGLTLQHGGFALVQERSGVGPDAYGINQNETFNVLNLNLSTRVALQLKQLFEVIEVRENSPAFLAGVRVGDEILEVNRKPAYQYTLNEINQLFYNKEGKLIRMKILRNGVEQQIRFELKDIQ